MSPRSTVALAVTGSIAAYKATLVARLLLKAGVRVVPVMTRSATEFLGPQTLSGITGEAVQLDMFDPSYAGERHVDLAARADVVVVVPATADLIARLAAGRADDLVSALCLCAKGPIVVAPAMHPRMWSHPATVRNVATLVGDRRVELVGPVFGEVASGEVGEGRLAEPEAIANAVLAKLHQAQSSPRSASTPLASKDLTGLRIVVTAGPTVEDIDPVRFVSNRSTGKMGFAIAEAAANRGATVRLVAGPVSLATPSSVERTDVRGALSMRDALWEHLGSDLSNADVLVMTAAVGDYRPEHLADAKLKRDDKPMTLSMVPNPDLLAEVGAARSGVRPVLIGFAVETDTDAQIVELARRKLENKRVDLIVANHAQDSFGRDDNRATLVERDRATSLGVLPKQELADRLLDRVLELAHRAEG